MCDAVSLSIASTLVGVAGSAASAVGQMNAQKKQEDAVNTWQDKQQTFREAEKVRQDDLRKQAEQARVTGLEQMGADAQDQRQEAEAARLAAYYTGDDPNATPEQTATAATAEADKAMLSGQDLAPGSFQSDMARKIAETTAESKQRMEALARATSYSGSPGSLSIANPIMQAFTGQEIGKFGKQREGSLNAFGLEKAIDPLEVQYTPDPLAPLFSAALSFGSAGLGNAAGAASGATGAAGAAGTNALVSDPWGGLRDLTLPKTVSTLPTARPIF